MAQQSENQNWVDYVIKLEKRIQTLEKEKQCSSGISGASSSIHAPSMPSTVPVIKPTKPETFEGQRDAAQVDHWLFQVQQYCTFVKMNNQDWVPFAALMLRGSAATWWQVKT